MKISYRRLEPEDSKAYRIIRLECLEKHPENFGSIFREEKNKPKLAFETFIEEKAPDNFIFGAFDEDKLIGICGFAREPKKKTRHIGTIIQVYVKLEYSGKGIGLELLNAAKKEAFKLPEIEQLMLGVVVSNKSANVIYEKAGFQQYGLHKRYFKEGDKYFDQRLMILYRGKL